MAQTLEEETKDLLAQIQRDKEALKTAVTDLRRIASEKVDIESYVRKAPATWILAGFRVGFFLGRLI